MSHEFRSINTKELTELRYDKHSYYQYLLKPGKIKQSIFAPLQR
jgi:hypothetical protein